MWQRSPQHQDVMGVWHNNLVAQHRCGTVCTVQYIPSKPHSTTQPTHSPVCRYTTRYSTQHTPFAAVRCCHGSMVQPCPWRTLRYLRLLQNFSPSGSGAAPCRRNLPNMMGDAHTCLRHTWAPNVLMHMQAQYGMLRRYAHMMRKVAVFNSCVSV